MPRSLSQLIQIIRTARYGRDMRTAIGDAFEVVGTGGAGNTSSIDITLANYTDLSEAEKMNGTIYFITDKGYQMRNGLPYGEPPTYTVVVCTQAEYDLLDPPDPYTEYNIVDPEE